MISRQRLTVRGIVQGVGFRPFIYRLAHELELSGWVCNDGNGVSIEAEGDLSRLTALQKRLHQEAPPRAELASVQVEELVPVHGRHDDFRILDSLPKTSGNFDAAIGPDATLCDHCLSELFDPENRRYRYAFINCTDCGPRYTLAWCLPYTRAATSMAGFEQCPCCLAEYTDPTHRRFHAEPNACPICGPQLNVCDKNGQPVLGDPIAEALRRLRRGEIIAIKGLGGFHLACDARQSEAVARLRARKHREEKPLALMFANIPSLADPVHVTPDEAAQLTGPARPIVLLRKQSHCDQVFQGVASGMPWLGALLPYTPAHYLLFHEAAGRPVGTDWLNTIQELALVMTSANPHGEPLVVGNAEAMTRLAGIADAYLLHDREIVTRCDDSVLRILPTTKKTQFIRRARGYVPRAIPLAQDGPDVLALGGVFKNTLCMTRRKQAYVSQHIGDLEHVSTCLTLKEAADHLRHILDVKPQIVAHDLHPDFFSTRLAHQLAAKWSVPTIAVQHHHAHVAAIVAEHGINEPVLGLALDGVGLGDDGTAWGGELLCVSGLRYERIGHLRQLGLPGGDRAAREPWRMAASALHLMGRADEIALRFAEQNGADKMANLLSSKSRVPMTSSMGRWFDAVAGLLGVQTKMSFEGQAAMRLEGLAAHYGKVTPVAMHRICKIEGRLILDLMPLLEHICDDNDVGRAAATFHVSLVIALVDWVEQAAQLTRLKKVACGGGCFLNAILTNGLRDALGKRGLTMFEAQAVPPGDGGLSLGQAWVARALLRDGA